MKLDLDRNDWLIILASLNLQEERAPLSEDAEALRAFITLRLALADREAACA